MDEFLNLATSGKESLKTKMGVVPAEPIKVVVSTTNNTFRIELPERQQRPPQTFVFNHKTKEILPLKNE